jgi:AraC-like DNA-binding protein
MENRLFSARNLTLLRNAEHWRLVASGLPEEVPAVRHRAHDAWALRHVDVHPNREMLVVLSGAGYQSLCGRTYPARPGTAFFFDAMEPHDRHYSPTQPSADHLWFHFMPDRCSLRFLRVRKGRGDYRSGWHGWYTLPELGLATADVLFPGSASSSPPETVRRRCAAAFALLMTSLVEKGYEKPQAHPKEDFHSGIIQTIVRHIQESHGRGCRLESLARIAGYSKYHFLRLFQKHTGLSLQTCVNNSRVQAFRKMAAAGTPLRVISSDLGFAFPSTLCRWRRRQRI